jgi:BlaI family penicillinase repressor
MRKMPRISDTEWEVMRGAWSQAPAAAAGIIEALRRNDPSWHSRPAKAFVSRLVKNTD